MYPSASQPITELIICLYVGQLVLFQDFITPVQIVDTGFSINAYGFYTKNDFSIN